jgi:hypothetical protein|tara:strand:+ start:462 stop:1085 length:624 start_codon:yes stop_codon:yes gene_type:complete
MASIKLKHASGNSIILNSPAANPSADVTLKLPSTTGSAGQVLKVASANHSATNAELEFAAAGASGKILNVVPNNQTFTSNVTTASTTFTNLTSTLNTFITPSSSSSKIFVIMSAPIYASNSFNGGIADYTIGRNGSVINNNSYGSLYQNASGIAYANLTMSILDTPGTDQQVGYNFMCKTNSSSNPIGIGSYGANEVVSITLFEVAP